MYDDTIWAAGFFGMIALMVCATTATMTIIFGNATLVLWMMHAWH